jgi:hypothetical protein
LIIDAQPRRRPAPTVDNAWSELALAEIARRLGRDHDGHLTEAARITAAMVDQLWSDDRGLLLGRDVRSGRLLPERTVAGLIPVIFAGSAL